MARFMLELSPQSDGTENDGGNTHLAALRAGRVVRLHVALEGVGRVEVWRVADGGVREIGRGRRGQDGGGGKLQWRVGWGGPC